MKFEIEPKRNPEWKKAYRWTCQIGNSGDPTILALKKDMKALSTETGVPIGEIIERMIRHCLVDLNK